jgi:hypothetical protein
MPRNTTKVHLIFSDRTKGRLCAAVFFFASLLAAEAESIAPFLFPSARSAALGGSHVALTDDFSSLFSNPAGFLAVKEEFSAAELSASAYGPIFDIADAVISYTGSSGNLDISGIVGKNGLVAGIDIGGPLAFGWVGRGLGFGFFNRTVLGASTAGVAIRALAREELLMTGGYAFNLIQKGSHTLDMGFLGKGFIRGYLALNSSIFTVTDIVSGNPLETKPFNTIAGVGVDLGARYDFSKTLAAALVCRDVYSPGLVTKYASSMDFLNGKPAVGSGSYASLAPQLDFGLQYALRSPIIDKYFSKAILLLDYRNILDLFVPLPRNPILNIGLGAEIEILDALTLRAGIGDALPSMGFGIDFTFMKLDFAMRGVELGIDPGIQTTYALDLGLLFRY